MGIFWDHKIFPSWFDSLVNKQVFLSLHVHTGCIFLLNHIDVVIISMFGLSAVDRGFESHSRSVHIIDYKISICCFFVEHPALRSKNKDWFNKSSLPRERFRFMWASSFNKNCNGCCHTHICQNRWLVPIKITSKGKPS